MKWFKRINSGEIKNRVIKKQSLKGAILFVVGTLTSALSFNLFCVPNNFVSGGLGGIGIILNHFFSNINVNLVILLGNLLFIIISLFTLGFKESLMSIVGATVFTVFLYVTTDIPELINFKFDNILLYVLGYGVASGFGESLVYKSGFNTGGTSILARILQKYISLPLGKILRYISIIIILCGGAVFGYTALMYSLIIMVISTSIVDKMLIGISDSKTFFIHTTKEDEVKDFILKIIESGVTEFDTKGAYSHKRRKMLMCVVSTEKYTLLKNAIHEIDSDAFIVVSDCYEVLGGTKRKKLSFDN